MNKIINLILLNLLILGLIGITSYGFVKLYDKPKAQQADNPALTDKYAYLTTGSLRDLPSLPETLQVLPTGQIKC